jgi:hypothetical protein
MKRFLFGVGLFIARILLATGMAFFFWWIGDDNGMDPDQVFFVAFMAAWAWDMARGSQDDELFEREFS